MNTSKETDGLSVLGTNFCNTHVPSPLPILLCFSCNHFRWWRRRHVTIERLRTLGVRRRSPLPFAL